MFSLSVISTTQGNSLRLLWFILPKWRLNVSLAALKLAEIYVVGCCWNSEEQKYRLFCSYFSITFQWFFLSLGLISAVRLWKLLIQNIKISIRFNIPIRMKSLHYIIQYRYVCGERLVSSESLQTEVEVEQSFHTSYGSWFGTSHTSVPSQKFPW